MRRRHLLAATGALGGTIGSALAAPSSARPKPVFLDYTQEQLDKAYDQSFWAPQMAQLEAGDGAASAEVRRKMPPRTERYFQEDDRLGQPDSEISRALFALMGI